MIQVLIFIALFGPTFNQEPAKKRGDPKLEAVLAMWEKQYTEIRNMRCVIERRRESDGFYFNTSPPGTVRCELTIIRPNTVHFELPDKQGTGLFVLTSQGY